MEIADAVMRNVLLRRYAGNRREWGLFRLENLLTDAGARWKLDGVYIFGCEGYGRFKLWLGPRQL